MDEQIVSYYFAPSHGYHESLWIRYADGRRDVWATGPHLEAGLEGLRDRGVPFVPDPA